MRRIILIAIMFASSAFAAVPLGPAVTVASHTACITEQYWRDATSFIVAGDKASFMAYVNDQKCLILKDGIPVHVIDGGFTYSIFSIQGMKFWVVDEGLRR